MNYTLIAILTVIIVVLSLFIAAIRSFRFDAQMIRDHSTAYHLTPLWTNNYNISTLRMAMKIMFSSIRIKEFRNWSPVKSRGALAGVILWKKINKGDKTIELTDVVFDTFDEAKIRRMLGNFVNETFMIYPGYSITIWTKEETKIQLIADSLRFVEHVRFNLIPKTDVHMGNSIKRYILYKEI